MVNDQITELRQAIKENQEIADDLKDLATLVEDPLFKKYIIDRFCTRCLVDNAKLANNLKVSVDVRNKAKDFIMSAGLFMNWIDSQLFLLERAKGDIKECEQSIETIIHNDYEEKLNKEEFDNE